MQENDGVISAKVERTVVDTENSGQQETVEQTAENSAPMTQEQMSEMIASLQSTNSRLLEESKRHKNQKQKEHEQRLLAEDKKDELLTNYRNEIMEMKEKVMVTRLEEAMSAEAQRRGCKHWSHLMQVGDLDTFISYDDESERVEGVKEFFDYHQNDDEYKLYFSTAQRVSTENQTPSNATVADYKTDPKAYLMKVQKERPSEFAQEVARLTREGLIA